LKNQENQEYAAYKFFNISNNLPQKAKGPMKPTK